jgi:RNA 2',3'-cyclic 3'-phosphodiesterase
MRASRFTVVCDALEFWAGAHAVVAAVQETPPALLDLSAGLHEAIGLPRAPLRAHVTLARKVVQASVLPAMSPIVWRAAHFNLIRSDTGGAESAYTVVDTWQLLDKT